MQEPALNELNEQKLYIHKAEALYASDASGIFNFGIHTMYPNRVSRSDLLPLSSV